MSHADLRPDARAFLDVFNATPLARMESMDVATVRAMLKQFRMASGNVLPGLAVRRDVTCAGSGAEFRLRLYDAQESRGPGPVIVFYHGGGFVLGDLDTHDALCAAIAIETALPVVAVDYRLAPEHRWPAAPEDAEAAARWVAAHSAAVLGREATALVLAGDSAGANLAAVTAGTLRDSPAEISVAAQLLIYPCTAAERDTGSRREFASGLFLTASLTAWFFDNYAAATGDPRIDLHARSLAGLPPTLVVTAGLDPLRDEGRDYAAALIRAGVPVIYQEATGNIHGCFSMAAAVPSTASDITRSLRGLRLILER